MVRPAEDDVLDLGHVEGVAVEAGAEAAEESEGLADKAGMERKAPGHPCED